MKYITTRSEDGLEEIFLFSAVINHDAMAEVIECIKNRTREPWHRVHRHPISAGFVSADGECYGRSESLRLEARIEDTGLLRHQLR
jgi:hypothetical protein